MKHITEKKQVTPSFLLLIGLFFLYLAISVQEINGNSVLLGGIGIGCLLAGFLLLKPVRRYLLKQLGIVEVDVEENKHHEDTL